MKKYFFFFFSLFFSCISSKQTSRMSTHSTSSSDSISQTTLGGSIGKVNKHQLEESYERCKPAEDIWFENHLKNTEWSVNAIVGLDNDVKIYKLLKLENGGKWAGNYLTFTDTLNFVSGYSAWCGNDYFTTVNGKYSFPYKDEIVLSVDSVSYSGEWTKPTEYRKTNYSVFSMSTIGDTLFLRNIDDILRIVSRFDQ